MPKHKTGRAKTGRDRNIETRALRKRILILCEGTETEPAYFNGLIRYHRLNGTVVEFRVEGAGRSTLSLITYAEGQRGSGSEKFDEIWCVFDKDYFADQDFDNAIAKAHSHKYLRAAWSNEAFELWYVLHFEYLDSATAGKGGKARTYYRESLDDLLRKHCGRDRYDKSDPDMYMLIGEDRRRVATKNARRLLARYDNNTPYHKRKPATTIHEMIEMLLQYAPDL